MLAKDFKQLTLAQETVQDTAALDIAKRSLKVLSETYNGRKYSRSMSHNDAWTQDQARRECCWFSYKRMDYFTEN